MKSKSALRYPGGKTKALKHILPLIPDCQEFREPFVGGGSVFMSISDRPSPPKIWINDLNYDLMCFWAELRYNSNLFADRIESAKSDGRTGRELYEYWRDYVPLGAADRAVRFFILNRISFSGLTDCGGYSQQAFENRFTQSSIDRLRQVKILDVKITCFDYEDVILAPGDDVAMYLDPPYHKPERSKLYGKKGDLHSGFDHERLAATLKQSSHQWLMTYDDSPKIRQLYGFANIQEFTVQYGMNNWKQERAKPGMELLIRSS